MFGGGLIYYFADECLVVFVLLSLVSSDFMYATTLRHIQLCDL